MKSEPAPAAVRCHKLSAASPTPSFSRRRCAGCMSATLATVAESAACLSKKTTARRTILTAHPCAPAQTANMTKQILSWPKSYFLEPYSFSSMGHKRQSVLYQPWRWLFLESPHALRSLRSLRSLHSLRSLWRERSRRRRLRLKPGSAAGSLASRRSGEGGAVESPRPGRPMFNTTESYEKKPGLSSPSEVAQRQEAEHEQLHHRLSWQQADDASHPGRVCSSKQKMMIIISQTKKMQQQNAKTECS